MPVALAKQLPRNHYLLQGRILGTCFALGSDSMITGGHVAERLQELEFSGVTGLVGKGSRILK